MDAVCISDLHLGSDICQVRLLESFLRDVKCQDIKTDQLVLNGDVFDSWDFRRLKKRHWRVLSLLRKMSDNIRVVWVAGNHDGPAELISQLIGVEVVNAYYLISGGRSIYFHHGHRYDTFIDAHPYLTWWADRIYWVLQKLDPSFRLARNAKQASKTFMRNSAIIEEKSRDYAKRHQHHAVCCGHTHHAVSKTESPGYFNSGCWTELPCTYLAVDNGQIELRDYYENITYDYHENNSHH
jgi:UDP-2,3-diacylglucosamine pyrophosphatase LpxH